ncbi:MAG: transcriptional repressor [Ruminococcaceae bacterium]|nr:transcriptional repressor [Oscillospiraceae bacterium]
MNELKNRYKTKQEALIVSFLKDNSKTHFSADEVFAAVAAEGVSRSTVYRRLERLAEDGVLLKFNLGNSVGALYQYCDHKHGEECLHFVCTKCKTLHHLDCYVFSDVQQHLNSQHKFLLDGSKTVFYGLCERCI